MGRRWGAVLGAPVHSRRAFSFSAPFLLNIDLFYAEFIQPRRECLYLGKKRAAAGRSGHRGQHLTYNFFGSTRVQEN